MLLKYTNVLLPTVPAPYNRLAEVCKHTSNYNRTHLYHYTLLVYRQLKKWVVNNKSDQSWSAEYLLAKLHYHNSNKSLANIPIEMEKFE